MVNSLHKKAAELAKQLYAGKITFSEFLSGVPEKEQDELTEELVDLITHEPQKGGFLGVSEEEHQAYMEKINKLIHRLESD
jgi:hypothetical protein